MSNLTYPTPANGTVYDFIVVGSGSAGSVVAGRLAEAGHSVLLVEAGAPSHWMQGIPALGTYFLSSPYDWNFSYKWNEKFGGKSYDDLVMPYPRGKSLGGSSMLNWMAYVRGHSKDFDEWEGLGNPGWSYKEVLPYFKKSERWPVSADVKFHGLDGPMSVQEQKDNYLLANVTLEAARELGYKVGDVNGELEDGGFFDPFQTTVSDGWRMGTYRSFVEPLLGKKAIDVLTFATAHKILIRGDDETYGVRLERFDRMYDFHVRKEVICAAGAVNSPQGRHSPNSKQDFVTCVHYFILCL